MCAFAEIAVYASMVMGYDSSAITRIQIIFIRKVQKATDRFKLSFMLYSTAGVSQWKRLSVEQDVENARPYIAISFYCDKTWSTCFVINV